jgi:hypothetical protein
MPSGRYQPLTDAVVRQVHEAARNVLENIGLADAIDSCLDVLLPKGCTLSEDGRLLFPRSLIEDTLAIAARNFTLHAQDPQFDMEPWGKKVYFGTAGAAVYMVDPITGEYRESLSQDAYDIARLVDTMEHIHFYQRSVVPRDLPDPMEMDVNTCYLSVAGTTKHVGTSWEHPDPSRSITEDAPPHRRRRGQVARTALRQSVELLRGAAAEVRRRRMSLSGSGGSRRHARAAALCRPGGCHRPGCAGGRTRAGGGGGARRAGLRERDQAGAPRHLRPLAVRQRPAQRRDVGR